MDEDVARLSREVFDSGSWSDVSDHLDNGSYDANSRLRSNSSYHDYQGALSDRLFNSLDLGHGSFCAVDSPYEALGPLTGPSSLPDHSMTNGDLPSNSRARTEKAVRAKAKSKFPTSASSNGESESNNGMKTKLLSAWNNMRHGEICLDGLNSCWQSLVMCSGCSQRKCQNH